MKHLIKHLFAKYEDFMEYAEMYEDCTDPAYKVELKKLAEEEMQHYKKLYDMIFTKPNADAAKWTEIEKGVCEYATHLWHEMEKKAAKLK